MYCTVKYDHTTALWLRARNVPKTRLINEKSTPQRLSNSITLEIAKNVYETSHLIHAQISLGCQQSISDTPTQ
jgi:hypothetical protein